MSGITTILKRRYSCSIRRSVVSGFEINSSLTDITKNYNIRIVILHTDYVMFSENLHVCIWNMDASKLGIRCRIISDCAIYFLDTISVT